MAADKRDERTYRIIGAAMEESENVGFQLLFRRQSRCKGVSVFLCVRGDGLPPALPPRKEA
jgi:hypothetical protein